jgi:hypothetical protein
MFLDLRCIRHLSILWFEIAKIERFNNQKVAPGGNVFVLAPAASSGAMPHVQYTGASTARNDLRHDTAVKVAEELSRGNQPPGRKQPIETVIAAGEAMRGLAIRVGLTRKP